MSRGLETVLFLVFLLTSPSASHNVDQCPRDENISRRVASLLQFLLPSNNANASHRIQMHCSDPWMQSFRHMSSRIFTNSTFVPQIQEFNEKFPHMAAISMDVAHLLLHHSRLRDPSSKDTLLETNTFLQFLDDSTITNSPECALMAVFLGWNAVLFTFLFVVKNPWFFFGNALPDEVGLAEHENHKYGMWAFFASLMFALIAGFCASHTLNPCSTRQLIGAVSAFPSFIWVMWGLVSATQRTPKAPKSEGETPRFAVTESYKWRLNVFPSQVEEFAIVPPGDNAVETAQSPQTMTDESQKLAKKDLKAKILELNQRRDSLHDLVGLFFLNNNTLLGLIALTASLLFASASCTV